jgi:hypothetical protein
MQERYEVVGKDGEIKGFLLKEPVDPPGVEVFKKREDTKFKLWIFGIAALGAILGSLASVGYAIVGVIIGLIAGGVVGSYKQIKAFRNKNW